MEEIIATKFVLSLLIILSISGIACIIYVIVDIVVVAKEFAHKNKH